MLDLGIVIVNYNVRSLLRECLASLYDGRGDLVYQVCVVDNGSQDGSADMVAAEFPQARLIRPEPSITRVSVKPAVFASGVRE